jgi:hypothetical protein
LAFSVVLRAEELSPVDFCLVVLAGSVFCEALEPEEDPELTVSDDDLLLVTVLCPADELVLALLLTVVVERFTALLFPPDDRLDVAFSGPADCLLDTASEACLLLLLFPVDILDALSGCTLA